MREEVGADGGFVAVLKLALDELTHEARLADPAVAQENNLQHWAALALPSYCGAISRRWHLSFVFPVLKIVSGGFGITKKISISSSKNKSPLHKPHRKINNHLDRKKPATKAWHKALSRSGFRFFHFLAFFLSLSSRPSL
jgi:hypothetical protein